MFFGKIKCAVCKIVFWTCSMWIFMIRWIELCFNYRDKSNVKCVIQMDRNLRKCDYRNVVIGVTIHWFVPPSIRAFKLRLHRGVDDLLHGTNNDCDFPWLYGLCRVCLSRWIFVDSRPCAWLLLITSRIRNSRSS